MKRLLAFFAGGFGLGALLGRRAGRASGPPALSGSPADELRARLAASRVHERPPSDVELAPAPGGDAEPEEPEAGAETLDERRARVHERARSAIDELSAD